MDNDLTKKVTTETDDLGIVFNAPHTDTSKAEGVSQGAPSPKQIREQKNSNLSNRDDVFDVTKAFSSAHGGEGSVISDRRHHRASITDNLKSAFSEWMGNTQAAIDRVMETRAPKIVKEEPTVAMGSSRTEIVREAAEHATIAPQDDHETVLKQFHTYKNDVDRIKGIQEVIVKNVSPKVIKSSWAHTENEPKKDAGPLQMPDLRSTMIAPVVSPKSISVDPSVLHTNTAKPPIKETSEQRPSANFSSITHSEAHVSQNRPIPKGSIIPPTISQVITPQNKITTNTHTIDSAPQEKKSLEQTKKISSETTVTTSIDHATTTPQIPADSLPIATSLTKEEVVGSWTHVIENTPEVVVATPDSVPQENISTVPTPPKPKEVPFTVSRPTAPLLKEEVAVQKTFVPPSTTVHSPSSFATEARNSVKEIQKSVEQTHTPSQSIISVQSPTTSRESRRTIVHTNEVKLTQAPTPPSSNKSLAVPHPSWVPANPSIYLFGGVGVVVLVLLIAGSAYFGFFGPTKNSSSETSIPTSFGTILPTSFFTVAHIVNEPLTADKEAFLVSVQKHIEQNIASDVQVRPTITENKSVRGATTQEFFTLLDTPLSYTLIKSLDPTFMLGGVQTTKQEPYLIIRSYNFEELFAGLLSWEGTMQSDFAPVFGVQKSPITPFVDAVQNNKSTRILYDANGNEVLLYSFVNHNTVVITTSGEALSALIGKF